MADKKTVVIIGASYGGLAAGKALASTHAVVLIDKRDYCELNFATPRLLQDPELETTISKKLSDFPWMPQVTLKQATVTELHSDHVALSTGETVKFDYCIIASGSTYANEFCKGMATADLETRLADVKATTTRLKDAKTVLVIGGGHTGMEMAAEAKEAGVEAVTLVQSAPHLADSEKRGKVYLARLRDKLGVEVILGQKAEAVEPEAAGSAGAGVYTIAGKSRSFDMVFKCVGFKPVHGAFTAPLGDISTGSGCIEVNRSFQVKGFPNIFAVGDAVDVDDDHVAYLAVEHGRKAAKAIQILTANPEGKLPAWKRSNGMRVTMSILGKKNALVNIGSSTIFTMVPGAHC